MGRSFGDGAGGAKATVNQGTVRRIRDAVVYPAPGENNGDSGTTPADWSIQCGGAGGVDGTSGTHLGRRKAGQEGKEAPGERVSGCRPRESGKGQSSKLVAQQTQWQRTQEPGSADKGHNEEAAMRARTVQPSKLEHKVGREDKRQEETVNYVPRGRVEDWDGEAVPRDVDEGRDQNAAEPQAKSTAHVGRANHDAESTTAFGERVEEADDGKARDAMPCAAERCPTHQTRSPARRRRQPPCHNHRQWEASGGRGWWG